MADLRARPPAFRAELARHPALRPEPALQQRWHIEIGVQAGPVQAEADRADFNFRQAFGRRNRQSFREPRRKGQFDPGAERHDHPRTASVITRRHGMAGFAQHGHALLGLLQFVLSNRHVWFSIPRTERRSPPLEQDSLGGTD